MGIINYDAKAVMLEKAKTFRVSPDDLATWVKLRSDFVAIFTKDKIKNLTPEDYFLGYGKKEDCLAYQLEWGTRPLGSIKGGSSAKYGPKEQFKEIKKLLIELTLLSDQEAVFYSPDGGLTEASRHLIAQSQKIKGMTTGKTVLGKMLTIYFPRTFVPIFNHQDYLLQAIGKDYSDDFTGLESYLRNNRLFLRIKEELLADPVFTKEIPAEQFTNDYLSRFLYACYPLTKDDGLSEDPQSGEDEKIEALETEHYQKLIHRNFSILFKGYRYFDEEYQNSHEGHYATEDVGIMDILCLNSNDDIVVIELKRRGTDETLAQLCRYMGWAKENLAKDGQKVCGLIVSENKDVRLEYAIKVVPNVSLKQMKLNVQVGDFS